MKRIFIAFLAVIGCHAALAQGTSEGDQDVARDSSCFDAYLKLPNCLPDIDADVGDSFNFPLNQCFALPDKDRTSTACTIAPTITLTAGALPGGLIIDSTDADNIVLRTNPTFTTAGTGTPTLTGDPGSAATVTDSFSWDIAASGSPDTIPEDGTNYFVCPDGNDALSGQTVNQRWRTLNKVTTYGQFNPGDDVWLCRRSLGIFEDQDLSFSIDGPSPDNMSILGTYDVVAGQPQVHTSNCEPPHPGTGVACNGAEINGTFENACEAARNCQVGGPGVPGGYFEALVEMQCSNCILQDMFLHDSNANGFEWENNGNHDNLLVQRIQVDHILLRPARLQRRNANAIVRDSMSNNTAYCRRDRAQHYPQCDVGNSIQGWAIVANQDAGVLVDNVEVSNHGGECFDCFNSRFCHFRNIRTRNCAVAMHADGSQYVIVENSVALGAGPSPTFATGTPNGWQFTIERPLSPVVLTPHHFLARNNLNVGGASCFNFFVGSNAGPADDANLENIFIYGNTCIDTENDSINSVETASFHRNWDVRNNIFWRNSGQGCDISGGTNMTFDYNLYRTQQSDSTCNGPNDVIGTPNFKVPSTNWQALGDNAADFATALDAAILLAGPGENDGPAPITTIPTVVANGVLSSWSKRNDMTSPCGSNPFNQEGLDEDRDCVARGNPMDMGFLER